MRTPTVLFVPGHRGSVLLAGLAAVLVACLHGGPRDQSRAQPPDGAPPRAAAPRLERGLNITSWLSLEGPPDRPRPPDDAFWRSYVRDADLAQIRAWGFDHVRLNIDEHFLFNETGPELNTHRLPYLDLAVQRLLDAGLVVVLDQHTEGFTRNVLKSRVLSDPNALDRYARYFEQFARHVAAQPWRHDQLVLELMNEPVVDTAAQWRQARDRLVAAYRAGAPDLTLLIDAPIVGSDADDPNAEPYTLGLEQAGPVADPNVIYSIHFYTSMLFTHQGAEFAPEYTHLANVPYPATAGSCAGVPTAGLAEHGQTEDLAAYCAGWDAATMERWVARAAAWASANHARLTVGEFGAYNRVTPAEARLRWIGDARRLFERYGLGWTLWAWDDPFGLDWRDASHYDRAVLAALGLPPAAPASPTSPPAAPATPTPVAPSPAAPPPAGDVWSPTPGTTWQWQLTGPLDPTVDAAAYDVDLFTTDAAIVADLHARGRRVICYLSAGSWEDWRPDRDAFPAEAIGNDYPGWPGEKWLDIRRLDLIGPPLLARLDLCRAKGFDAVEPDNLDGYAADSGFLLTDADQRRFNRWLAQEAHARGLAIGLKNDAEQVPALVDAFDFVVVESCFERHECDAYMPFVAAAKAVFAAEYRLDPADFCAEALARRFDALRKERELDAARVACSG